MTGGPGGEAPAAVTGAHPAAELLARRRADLTRALDPLVPAGSRVALLDFPWHSNVGDSAIWLGELEYLRRRGCRVVHASDSTGYDPRLVDRRLGPDGLVLLHGGGNFGDLYQRHQALRARVVSDLRHRTVVQLPQTVHFSAEAVLDRFAAQAAGHPSLHVLVRDRLSAQVLGDRLGLPAVLAPDMALSLPPAGRTAPPEQDLLLLLRSDHETSGLREEAARRGLTAVDWLDPRLDRRAGGTDRLASLARKVERRVPARAGRPLGAGVTAVLGRRAARERRRGVGVLCAGRVVVTDRLHAHLLALMHGIPHVVLSDRNGKVSRFSALWVGEHPLVRRADTLDAALERAGELLTVTYGT